MAFHQCARLHPDYYVYDALSDLLSNGKSSRLHRHLIKEKRLFNSVDAYVSGSIDAGLFVIYGKPAQGISLEEAEAAVRDELALLQNDDVDETELEKVKNKYESHQIFHNLNYLNVATSLAYHELIGKAEDIDEEVTKYRKITPKQLRRVAREAFGRENGSVLYYRARD